MKYLATKFTARRISGLLSVAKLPADAVGLVLCVVYFGIFWLLMASYF